MSTARARRGLNMNAMAAAMRGPNADTRVWLTLARITDLAFDPDHGVFADVVFLPDGTEETARVSVPYAGGGWGAYWPLRVDDVVLVGLPNGLPDAGPIVIARMWDAADKPPAELAGENDPNTNTPNPDEGPYLRVQPDKTVRVRTSGTGGINLIVEGDGPVSIEARGSGKITVKQSGSADIEILVSTGKVNIGGENLTSLLNGVVVGQGIDPFTGQTYGALGSASDVVRAKK